MLTFKCRKFDLQNELDAIATAVDKKSKDEIYSCIYLTKLDVSTLLLAAASRDLMVTTSIKIDAGATLLPDAEPKDGTQTKALAVNADKLLGLCRKLPDKIIDFAYDPKMLRITVRCDSSHFTLGCQEPTFFPAITNPKDLSFKVPLRWFWNAIKNSNQLVSGKEGGKISDSGAMLSLDDKILEMVSTDGNRLAKSFTTLETDKSFATILPRKILVELLKTLENQQHPSVGIEATPNHAFISFGRYVYRTGVLAGSFPNYRVLIDQILAKNETKFRIKRNELVTSIERCLVFVGKDQGFGINFAFKEHEIVLTVANDKGDSAHELVEAECPEGITYQCRLNGEYLLQYLSTVSTDESVDMWVNAKEMLRPVYMRSQSDRNYLWMAMPMSSL